MQCGWFKEVRVKDLDSHAIKALLVSRALLVKIKRDIENQIRGLLKNLGLIIGRAKMNTFSHTRRRAGRGPAGTRRCGRAATQVT
jgi:transposase